MGYTGKLKVPLKSRAFKKCSQCACVQLLYLESLRIQVSLYMTPSRAVIGGLGSAQLRVGLDDLKRYFLTEMIV